VLRYGDELCAQHEKLASEMSSNRYTKTDIVPGGSTSHLVQFIFDTITRATQQFNQIFGSAASRVEFLLP
jgi:hypothetical protein